MPFVLIIRERGSSWAGRDPIATIHPSREEAEAELLAYVREMWEVKMDQVPPEDDDEIVERYFAKVLEECLITEAT